MGMTKQITKKQTPKIGHQTPPPKWPPYNQMPKLHKKINQKRMQKKHHILFNFEF